MKDLKLEIRSRYAINTLLMFVLSTILLVVFAISNSTVTLRVSSALLWIIILFSAIVGLGRAFISEVERQTVLLLQLNASAGMVYAGKLLFNMLLTFGLNLVAILLYWFILDLEVLNPGLLFTVLGLGAIGLAGATTLLSAIIAKTSNQGPLFAVLAFPILIPLLFSVVSGTQNALQGLPFAATTDDLLTLISYAGTVITASVLLFDFVWHD